jgi:hypothetical protein
MVPMRNNVKETTRTSAGTQLVSLQQQQQKQQQKQQQQQQQQQQHFCKHGALHPEVSQEKQNFSGSTATYSPHLSLSSTYFLFQKFKISLKGYQFESVQNTQEKLP